MKARSFLTAVVIALSLISHSQIIYYDAMQLSKYLDYNSNPVVFKNDLESTNKIAGILKNYCQGLPANPNWDDIKSAMTTNVAANKDFNPFIAPMLNITRALGAFNIEAPSLKGFSAGSLDLTNFADGLAKFLIERSKEELNVTFFRKFQDFLKKYPELKIVFPATNSFIQKIYSYQYASMLPALRAAFQKDLNTYAKNLVNLRETSNYDGYATDNTIKARADAITGFLATLPGRSAIGTLLIADGLARGDDAVEVIHSLAEDKGLSGVDNLSQSIQFVDLVSQSIKGNTGTVWITKQEATGLFQNEYALKIYFGLLYASNLMKSIPVEFDFNGTKLSLKKILTDLNTNWSNANGQHFIKTYKELLQAANEVSKSTKKIQDIKAAGEQPLLEYADYAASLSHFLKVAVSILPANEALNSDLAKLKTDIEKFTAIIDEAVNSCYDLKSHNYGALVMHMSSLLSSVLPEPNYKFKDDFVKYGTFMAAIVEAQNSDEVKAAIETAVLPVGSASIKRETDCNISLNAFIGPFAGAEYLPRLKKDQWAFAGGITAPVGVAFSWGNYGNGKREDPEVIKKNSKGVEKGGHSVSLFIPVIDIGTMASFRAGNDSSEVASKVTLNNIISPGLYVYWGLPKCPVSLGLGGQIGPQLREVTAQKVNIDKNFYFRFGFNIVIDIPLFNLYTKN